MNNKDSTQGFREATRVQDSFIAPLERKCLVWLADRLPQWVHSDHLTLLGFVAMILTGLSLWLSRWSRGGLLLAIVFLGLNWFGDSLDGTLARVRNKQRPRYGFYVDHVLDTFGVVFVMAGLALSGYMSVWVAVAVLIGYLLLSVEVYLATYTLGAFRLSFWKISPTELRILAAIGYIIVLFNPTVRVLGQECRFFDVAGVVSTSVLVTTVVLSAIRNTVALYRAEPIS